MVLTPVNICFCFKTFKHVGEMVSLFDLKQMNGKCVHNGTFIFKCIKVTNLNNYRKSWQSVGRFLILGCVVECTFQLKYTEWPFHSPPSSVIIQSLWVCMSTRCAPTQKSEGFLLLHDILDGKRSHCWGKLINCFHYGCKLSSFDLLFTPACIA